MQNFLIFNNEKWMMDNVHTQIASVSTHDSWHFITPWDENVTVIFYSSYINYINNSYLPFLLMCIIAQTKIKYQNIVNLGNYF